MLIFMYCCLLWVDKICGYTHLISALLMHRIKSLFNTSHDLVQGCTNSNVSVMQLLLSCTKPSISIIYLTNCGLVTPRGDINVCTRRQEAITWTNDDFSSVKSGAIHLGAILQGTRLPSSNKISFKCISLKFHYILSGANELMFLTPTTYFHMYISWEWTYDGYHKGHKTKMNQNMCGIMYYAMLYPISGRLKVLGFYSYLYTVTLAYMWLLNNLPSFVKNVIIVKHNTSAIGKTCPNVVLYCFLKYMRECQFFKEIVIFQKSDPFFVLFQTAITLLILTLHWKAMLFWKCLYPYFNFKWLFAVATEWKILLWHTYL